MDSCEGQMVTTVDTDGCLLVYPLNEWEVVERKLMALPNGKKAVRRLQRLILGHASESEMSAQGRILIPEPLREFAGIEKSVMLVGQGNKFELWDADRWDSRCEQWVEEANEEEDNEQLDGFSL